MCQKYSALLPFPRAYFSQMSERGGTEDREKEYVREASEYAQSPQAVVMLLCVYSGTHVGLAFTP
jgi:hypothetical protein